MISVQGLARNRQTVGDICGARNGIGLVPLGNEGAVGLTENELVEDDQLDKGDLERVQGLFQTVAGASTSPRWRTIGRKSPSLWSSGIRFSMHQVPINMSTVLRTVMPRRRKDR
jgi:hypothetical protein